MGMEEKDAGNRGARKLREASRTQDVVVVRKKLHVTGHTHTKNYRDSKNDSKSANLRFFTRNLPIFLGN